MRLAIWFNLQDNEGWPAGLLREDETEKPAWARMFASPKRYPQAAPALPLTADRLRGWVGG